MGDPIMMEYKKQLEVAYNHFNHANGTAEVDKAISEIDTAEKAIAVLMQDRKAAEAHKSTKRRIRHERNR